ncbi:helicase ARIP4-like [Mercenaria mercenaria]|uniref:helicase ARIP4-like n=1 Tax=Mercenaria mercenaria TaxID=6596 RepID=UPI00234F056D|nr:helicase ARIP4-like [Mercenaria mercenaria]
METEPSIVAPSFSQGQEASFEANDFGMDNFPEDEDFPMDDGYDDAEVTENPGEDFQAGGDTGQDVGKFNQSAVPKANVGANYAPGTFRAATGDSFPKGDDANEESSGMDDYPIDNNYDEPYDQNDMNYADENYEGQGNYESQGYDESDPSQGYEGDMNYAKQGAVGHSEGGEGYYPPEEGYYDQYDQEEANEVQGEAGFEGEEGDEEYEEEEEEEEEEEGESEGEESEEESEDEDVTDAINSLDFDSEFGLEGESAESINTQEPASADMPGTSGQTTEDSSDKPEKKKRKRKKKEGPDSGNKQKRKRKKKGESGEDGEKKKADKGARKNIRKILSENKLEKETLDAQAAELERQRRLQELKKQQLASLLHVSQEKEPKKEKDSQLKSLLQAAEEEAEKETDGTEVEKKEEKKDERKGKKEGVIDISSGEDDEDVVMVNSEEEEEEEMSDEDYAEAEDVNNSGSHINDMYNIPDDQGRVLVNVGHPTSDPDIYLSNLVAKHIKPHQIGGVRFLYDNLVECVNRFKTSAGFGCILAHSMGLGKTIQMIGFIDIFLRHAGARTVMVIVPINTLANWMAEFNMWVPDKETCEKYNIPPEETEPRPYKIFVLNDNYKNTPARAGVVGSWYQTGGVLLLGYEMYRLLSSKKVHLQKAKGRKKVAGSNVIDVEEEDRDKKLLMSIHEALVNPGPDLVVCDEGHRIKNTHAGISQSLKQIKTKRRIVLTGYPLQNNLIEYWCMVDFVRPNFLGTKTEFCNMFERPIMNGQCADSTPQDVRLMRYRAHVLHSLLEGFVQRRGHTVLQAALPPKEEYVHMIRMSPIQQKLYEKFMESITDASSNGWVNNNPLKAFSVCCKIWNHPDILFTCMKKSLDDNDLDIETGEPKKKGGRGRNKKETPPATPNPEAGASPGAQGVGFPGQGPTLNIGRQNEPTITYDWANEILKDYVPGQLDNGGKMVILFSLIEQSLLAGDKILVFSQSLFTLNLIEEFLGKFKVPRPELDEYWCRNKNYFRLDGSTSSSDREKLINQFNSEPNKWVFLLSTRAGSLGINLVAANRVVVVDASWNPCHDCQAICRVYRFGQVKPSYIYRLVTENTMERKIYDRQVNKQGMSDRVVDELNPQNQFRREHVDKLMYHENKEYPIVDFSTCEDECNDSCMVTVLKNQGHWLTSKPFTHESLLIDRKELKLTMKEKRLAKQSYVMEKRLNVSYSRPSYAAYYPRGVTPYQGTIRGRGGAIQRPIASVKPMVSTPVPMRPKIVAAPQILKPGVSVHQVLTTTEIVLPGTNTSTEAGTTEPKKIPAGQQVLVIRTPKGVYIRTPDGKIFAVRSKPQPDSTSPLDTLANTGSGMSTGVTIVRPTTTTTVSAGVATSKLPAGVTVIRPKPSPITTTKPLTIIRQGPGQVRTIIPVTIGAKVSTVSTTTGQMAIISAQSQKVSANLPTSSKIRIVTPNTTTSNATGTKVSSLAALKNLSEGKKTIANTPVFSGENTVKKVAPKQQPVVQDMKNIIMPKVGSVSGKPETSTDMKMDIQTDNNMQKNTATNVGKESSWNLPPIDMKALKLPRQLSGVQSSDSKKMEQNLSSLKNKTLNKSVKHDITRVQATGENRNKKGKPKFSLSGSPSDSSQSASQSPVSELLNTEYTPPIMPQSDHLSTRPSDIDLHEMKLSGNQNSTTNLSQMMSSENLNQTQSNWLGNPGNQSMSFPSNSNQNQSDSQQNQPAFQQIQSGSQQNQFGIQQTQSGSRQNRFGNQQNKSGSLQNQFGIQQNQSSIQQNVGFQQPAQPAQKSTSRSNSGIFNPGLPDMTSANEMKSGPGAVASNQPSNQGQMFMNNQEGTNMYGDTSSGGFMNMQGSNRNMAVGFGNQTTFQGQSSDFGNQNSGFGTGNAVPQQNSDTMADFTMSGIHNNSSFLSELTDADDNFLSQLDAGSDQNSQSSVDSTQMMNQSASGMSQNVGMGNQSGSIGSQSGNMGMPSHQQGNMNFDMFSNQQQQNPNFFQNFSGNNQFNRSNSFGGQQNVNMSQQGGFPGGSMYPMGGMMQPSMFPYAPFAPYPYPPMMAPMPYYPMPFQPQYGGQGGNMGQQTGNMGQQGPNIAQPGSSMGMPVGQQGDNSFQPGMGNQ